VIFENQKYTDEKTVVAEHVMGKWTITETATVLHPETQQRVCKVCGGATEKRTVGSRLTPTITLNATKFPMKVNQSTSKLKVTGLADGDSIKSVTSNKKKIVKVVSVNANGTIKLKAQKKTGTAKLTITLASGLQKKVTVKVQKTAVKTTKISGLSKTLVLQKGKKFTLRPVVTPITSQDKLTYQTSNKKVATVSKSGVITAKKVGKAKITVKSGKKKFTVTVKVQKTAVKTTKITGLSKTLVLKKGKKATLNPVITPVTSQDKLTYQTSNKKVATVSKSGVITAKKAGKAKITMKSGKKKFTVTVTVE
jgi:uncharacterized protein YjdB